MGPQIRGLKRLASESLSFFELVPFFGVAERETMYGNLLFGRSTSILWGKIKPPRDSRF